MAKFGVTITLICNGWEEVGASDEQEAREIIDNMLGYDKPDVTIGNITMSFGECMIDYVEKIND